MNTGLKTLHPPVIGFGWTMTLRTWTSLLIFPLSPIVLVLASMFKALFKAIRYALIGALGAAVAAKFMLESNAEPETEEIDLVAVFDGKELRSTASPFYGGKVLSIFGGVMIDLRKATPSPTGIDLDLMIVMSGLSLIVPEGWRVMNNAQIIAGGLDDRTQTTADEDVPTVNLRGIIAMGGVQIVTKSSLEAVA